MKNKPTVTQKITLTIKGKSIELTKEEALEIARQLDEVTGRKLPVPAPIIIEKERIRDRDYPRPMQPYFGTPPVPQWWHGPTCEALGQMIRINGKDVTETLAAEREHRVQTSRTSIGLY